MGDDVLPLALFIDKANYLLFAMYVQLGVDVFDRYLNDVA